MPRSFLYSPLVAAALIAAGTVRVAAQDNPAATSGENPSGDAITLAPMVITASPLIGSADTFSTIVGQVNRDEIVRNGGANLADALADVPGVTGTNFAVGASRPVIRGFDANRVRILEDGIGSFDASDVGPDHGVPIDPLAAQKIEVVRGAASLRYGSQAIGGVVNAINNRVPTVLPEKTISGEIEGAYGLNADTKEGSALVDLRAGNFAIHGDAFGRKSDDYDTPVGNLTNSFSQGDGFSLGSSYFFGKKSRIGAAAIHYDSKYGIPGEDTYIDMKQTKELLDGSFAIGLGPFQTLNVQGGHGDYEHSEIEADGSIGSTFKNKEWDSRVEALFSAIGPFSSGAIGTQIQHRDFSALGEGADYLLPTTTKSEAGFLFAEAPIVEGLKLQLGARVERVSIEGTPNTAVATKRNFTPVSGSAGLVFAATETTTFGLTLSSAARAPAQTELFAIGPHDGPVTFEIGDPTLKVERSNSVEGTVRIRDKGVRFDGSLWAAKFDNYIFGNLTGNFCDEDGVCQPVEDANHDLKEMYYEQSGATFWGAEAKPTVDLYRIDLGVLQANFLADYVRAKLDNGDNVPRIPPYHLGAGLTWIGDMFDAGFMVKYAGEQDKVGNTESPTRSFITFDADLAYRPFVERPELEFAVEGHNLTDTIQRNAVALNKDEVILPGREVRFVVRTRF